MKAASLTSTLLARKGTAAPSHLRAVETVPPPEPGDNVSRGGPASGPQMGVVAGGRSREPHPDASGRIKLSLRLDQARHRRLRLAGAHTGRHLQDILVEAVDRYLDEMGPALTTEGCSCFPTGARPRSVD